MADADTWSHACRAGDHGDCAGIAEEYDPGCCCPCHEGEDNDGPLRGARDDEEERRDE